MTWLLVDIDTGTVIDLRGVVRLIDYDALPDEARQLFDTGNDVSVAVVAMDYGYPADIFTDTKGIEISSVHPDARLARIQAVRDGFASDFVVGWYVDGLDFVCEACSLGLPLGDNVLTVSDVVPGEICYSCGGLLAD